MITPYRCTAWVALLYILPLAWGLKLTTNHEVFSDGPLDDAAASGAFPEPHETTFVETTKPFSMPTRHSESSSESSDVDADTAVAPRASKSAVSSFVETRNPHDDAMQHDPLNATLCQKVCSPDVCVSAICRNQRNATCLPDLCGCSLRFVTLSADRTGLVDVTSFCDASLSPQLTSQPSNELPVIPDGPASPVGSLPVLNNTASSSWSAVTPAGTQGATNVVPQLPSAPHSGWGAVPVVPAHSWGSQAHTGGLSYGGLGGVFSPLTYGQNGLWTIAPNLIRRLPFGALVVPGYGYADPSIEAKDDESINDVNDSGSANDEDSESADDEDSESFNGVDSESTNNKEVLGNLLKARTKRETGETVPTPRKGGKNPKMTAPSGKDGAEPAAAPEGGEAAPAPDGGEGGSAPPPPDAGPATGEGEPPKKVAVEGAGKCPRKCGHKHRCLRNRKGHWACHRVHHKKAPK